MFQSLRYLQDQAARGNFRRHSTALLVLTFLVTNMWVKVPNNDNANLGDVMYGRSSMPVIAAGTALSRRAVQEALTWLVDENWVYTERCHDPSGREDRRVITVKLDAVAHRERERTRTLAKAAEDLLAEVARA
jgi:hypothetical protein